MTLRALSIWGALVTFLWGGVAGAAEVSYNLKRYLAESFFGAISDAQGEQILLAAENPSANGTVDVFLDSVNRRVTYNVGFAGAFWGQLHEKYPNANIKSWKDFNNQYKTTFVAFGYKGVDGDCWYMPRTVINGEYINRSFTELKVSTFSSDKRQQSSGMEYIAFNSLPESTVHYFGSGWTSYPQDDIEPYKASWTAGCFQPHSFMQFVSAPYSTAVFADSAARQSFVAATIRGAAVEYYRAETVPTYNGLTFEGYTDSDLLAACTASSCPGYDPGTGGTGGTGTTPACTKDDGTTSGNPYDCAPSDSTVNCSIIDIPCNLRKAFIPSSNPFAPITDILKTKIPFSIFAKMFAPTETCALNIPIRYMTLDTFIPLDFCAINTRNSVIFTNMIKLFGSIMAVLALGKIGRFL